MDIKESEQNFHVKNLPKIAYVFCKSLYNSVFYVAFVMSFEALQNMP